MNIYFRFWEMLENTHLQLDAQDQHIWKLSSSGIYYVFFARAIRFAPWKQIWKSRVPLWRKIFIWLAVLNHYWTADRLSKWGVPHPVACRLCDQSPETINHLLILCVVLREVWYTVFQKIGLQAISPQPDVASFSGWWNRAFKRLDKEHRKGVN